MNTIEKGWGVARRNGKRWKWTLTLPPVRHWSRGVPLKFFPNFSLEWVLLAGSDTPRKRLEALGGLCSSGLLPLPRVSGLKGSERVL